MLNDDASPKLAEERVRVCVRVCVRACVQVQVQREREKERERERERIAFTNTQNQGCPTVHVRNRPDRGGRRLQLREEREKGGWEKLRVFNSTESACVHLMQKNVSPALEKKPRPIFCLWSMTLCEIYDRKKKEKKMKKTSKKKSDKKSTLISFRPFFIGLFCKQ